MVDVHEQLKGWGYTRDDGALGSDVGLSVYRRAADDRTVIIRTDGKLTTYQGGGSSRTVDLATFARDYAKAAHPIGVSWFRRRKCSTDRMCRACRGWGVERHVLARAPRANDPACPRCSGSGEDPEGQPS